MLDSYQATKQPPQPALSDVSTAFDNNCNKYIKYFVSSLVIVFFILKFFMVLLMPSNLKVQTPE